MSGFALATVSAAGWISTWAVIPLAVASVALCVWLERAYDAKVRNDTELRVRYELIMQHLSNQREG